jgi:exonuclease VII large subunit
MAQNALEDHQMMAIELRRRKLDKLEEKLRQRIGQKLHTLEQKSQLSEGGGGGGEADYGSPNSSECGCTSHAGHSSHRCTTPGRLEAKLEKLQSKLSKLEGKLDKVPMVTIVTVQGIMNFGIFWEFNL